MRTSKTVFFVSLAAVALIGLTGCRPRGTVQFPTYFAAGESYQPSSSSNNAYDGYRLAAETVRKDAAEWMRRSRFTPVFTARFLAATEPAISQMIRASERECRFEFRAQDPFLPRPENEAWAVIGRASAMRIERAAEAGHWREAVTLVVSTHKMAADLQGGDTSDAATGFAIAQATRLAIAPYLPELPAGELQRLGRGVLSAMDNAPRAAVTLDNEAASFRAGVQFVRDAAVAENWTRLEQAMYKDIRPAVNFLRGLSPEERVEFLNGLAEEGETLIAHARNQLDLPAVEREDLKFDKNAERPWKRLARQLFGTLTPYKSMRDAWLAQSRLLGLTALAYAGGKTTGRAPEVFTDAPAGSTLDPYSGKPFPYRTAGREFRIYAVGIDGQDDNGQSDDAGLEPDVVIAPLTR